MEITTSVSQSRVFVTILRLTGDLDANSADSFSATAEKAISDGAKDILVDLTHVPFMSSAGIRALHGLYTQLHTADSEQDKDSIYQGISAGTYSAPHLKLLKPTKKVEDVIKLSGLDMYIKSFHSEQDALAAF